jgi:hypothetical protein
MPPNQALHWSAPIVAPGELFSLYGLITGVQHFIELVASFSLHKTL